MKKQSKLLNKIIIVGLVILFIGAVVTPSISGDNTFIKSEKKFYNISPINDDFINSYWKFDECSGDIAYDSSGNGYDGTIHGATWVGSDPDCALEFDGVDDYVNFSDHAEGILFNNTDDLIITFEFSSTDGGVIYSGTASWGYNPEFRIELFSNGTLYFKMLMSFQGTNLYSNGVYNDGEYHNVKYYFNGISTAPTATLYVDDELDNSITHYLHDFENVDFKKATMGMHCHTLTDNFDGIIDDFKIIKYEKGNDQNPPIISGPSGGLPEVEIDYTFKTNDPEDDEVWILIDWGDETEEDWRGPFNSGEEVIIPHIYEEEGTYEIKAKSMDMWDDSAWSNPFEVVISSEVFPKICCDAVGLNFGNATAGSTVTGQIEVCNCGDGGSFLSWYVDTETAPTWGTWTFTPENGADVAEGDCVTIDVTCVLTDTQGEYSGTIKVVNSDDSSDYCEIDSSVIVPRARSISNIDFFRFYENHPVIYLLLKLFLGF
jgi:hypothetical protein